MATIKRAAPRNALSADASVEVIPQQTLPKAPQENSKSDYIEKSLNDEVSGTFVDAATDAFFRTARNNANVPHMGVVDMASNPFRFLQDEPESARLATRGDLSDVFRLEAAAALWARAGRVIDARAKWGFVTHVGVPRTSPPTGADIRALIELERAVGYEFAPTLMVVDRTGIWVVRPAYMQDGRPRARTEASVAVSAFFFDNAADKFGYSVRTYLEKVEESSEFRVIRVPIVLDEKIAIFAAFEPDPVSSSLKALDTKIQKIAESLTAHKAYLQSQSGVPEGSSPAVRLRHIQVSDEIEAAVSELKRIGGCHVGATLASELSTRLAGFVSDIENSWEDFTRRRQEYYAERQQRQGVNPYTVPSPSRESLSTQVALAKARRERENERKQDGHIRVYA